MVLHAAFRLISDALMKGINIPGIFFRYNRKFVHQFSKEAFILFPFKFLPFSAFSPFPFLGKIRFFLPLKFGKKRPKMALFKFFFLMGIDYQCLENVLFKFFFGQVLDFSKFML